MNAQCYGQLYCRTMKALTKLLYEYNNNKIQWMVFSGNCCETNHNLPVQGIILHKFVKFLSVRETYLKRKAKK